MVLLIAVSYKAGRKVCRIQVETVIKIPIWIMI